MSNRRKTLSITPYPPPHRAHPPLPLYFGVLHYYVPTLTGGWGVAKWKLPEVLS